MNIRDSIKAMRENAQKATPKYFKSSGYGKYLRPSDLNEGKTVLRIAPPHDPVNFPSPFMPSRYTYLEVELGVDELSNYNIKDVIEKQQLQNAFGVEKASEILEWDNDKLVSKAKEVLGQAFKTKVTKRIFIATIHGPEGSKDLVESYIQWVVEKVSSEIGDQDERKKRLAPIFGARIQGKWKPGIAPSTNYVCYGWEWNQEKPFFKIELYGNMMDRIEELYDKFDEPDKPITIDPFSNESEGIGLEFEKKKNAKGGWDFKIEDVPFSKKYDSYTDFQKSFALTDELKKQLSEVPTLESQFGRKSFTEKDFKLQFNGLILFDEKHKYGAFQNDEFIELVEEIAAQFDKDAEAKESEKIKNAEDIEEVFKEKPGKVQKREAEEAAKKQEVEHTTEVEENSFKEEEVKEEKKVETKEEASGADFNKRLAALRKNLKK